MKIRNFSCRFHRNGVMGEGFHLCSFAWKDFGTTLILSAVVFEAPGRIAVFWPGDHAIAWRGDNFEPALRKLIAESDASGISFARPVEHAPD